MKKLLFVLLCISGAGHLYALTGYTLDENQDGKPDSWFLMENNLVREFRADRNFDGRVDQVSRFDGQSRLEYEEYDFNYDGEMDDFYYFEGGVLTRHEIDSNFDNVVDLTIHLHKGLYIRRIEKDIDFDGKMDHTTDYDKK